MPDLSDQINTSAAGPRQVTVDGNSVQAQPLPDLIAADRYLAEKAVAGSRKSPLRFARIIPPDALGANCNRGS